MGKEEREREKETMPASVCGSSLCDVSLGIDPSVENSYCSRIYLHMFSASYFLEGFILRSKKSQRKRYG